jgi:hypothetical protein
MMQPRRQNKKRRRGGSIRLIWWSLALVTNERSISKHFSVPSLVRFSSFPLSHHISSSSASAVQNSSGMLHPEKSYITLDTFSQIGVGE